METAIDPALDSFAGNIEIAIYMVAEIEDELADICHNNEERVNNKIQQLHARRKH